MLLHSGQTVEGWGFDEDAVMSCATLSTLARVASDKRAPGMLLSTIETVDCDTCAADGVLGALVGMIGAFAAMQAIRVILNGKTELGDPQWGKLHILDGIAPGMRTMTIAKDPACRTCGSAA